METDAIIEAVWQEIHDSTLDGAESTPITAALVALYEAECANPDKSCRPSGDGCRDDDERGTWCPEYPVCLALDAVTAILKEAEHA